MAFDHEGIALAGRDRLRAKLSYTNLGFALAPATFTISELRDLYRAALGHDVSPTNLKRVLLRRGVLEQTGTQRCPGPAGGRPAELYRFRSPRARDHGSVRGAQAAAGNVTRRLTSGRSPVRRIALIVATLATALGGAAVAFGATILINPAHKFEPRVREEDAGGDLRLGDAAVDEHRPP